jgi:hypothetical protein
MDDPVVNPSTSKPLPPLPRATLSKRKGQKALAESAEEEDEREGWETARWSRSTRRVSSNAEKTISIAAPSVVLIEAKWKAESEITVNVFKNGSILDSTKSNKIFDGRRYANAIVKVPSAGDLLIKVAATGKQPVTLELHIGILDASP